MSVKPDHPCANLEQGTKMITAKVIAVLSEFKQVIVETGTGWRYAIVDSTNGIKWYTLEEGDKLELEIYTALSVVKEVLYVDKSRC